MIVGYTQGTFDLFHIGHLNMLTRAKEQCDYLIVGVNADELVEGYKGKTPIIPENERAAIVGALKVVDEVYLSTTLSKTEAHAQHLFDKIFIGDDWKGNPRWEKTEADMNKIGVELVWLNYTRGVSSTILRGKLDAGK